VGGGRVSSSEWTGAGGHSGEAGLRDVGGHTQQPGILIKGLEGSRTKGFVRKHVVFKMREPSTSIKNSFIKFFAEIIRSQGFSKKRGGQEN